MNIVNLHPDAILMLSEAASRADLNGQSLRISIEGPSNFLTGVSSLKYKVGEGTWSPPHYDQPDAHRD